MTGLELKTLVESLIDDTIESTLFYQLLNVAKDNVEDDRDWEILKSIDISQTASSSDTYTTMKSLPSDFRLPLDHLYVGTDKLYKPIPFTKRISYRSRSGFFYIDYANSQFAVIGAPATSTTIYLPYIITTDDIEADTSWTFPSRFHKLLAFMVAGYYTAGVDADDIYARMSPEHKMAAQMIQKNLESWNTKLTLNSMDYSASPYVEDNQINIGDL